MSRFSKGFRRLLVRQDGQGMTEYGLIIALIAVILITTLSSMSGGLKATFSKVTTELNKAAGAKK